MRRLLPENAVTYSATCEKHLRGTFGWLFHQKTKAKELTAILKDVKPKVTGIREKFNLADARKLLQERSNLSAQELQEKWKHVKNDIEVLMKELCEAGARKKSQQIQQTNTILPELTEVSVRY
ncbi:hypothetical protein FRC09_011934 [Ceratobasidium sp. 395]|nr:hypothetical protein FRC09_011934 [Ceratobasidium sp. 395]